MSPESIKLKKIIFKLLPVYIKWKKLFSYYLIISRASLRKIRGEYYCFLETELQEIIDAKNSKQCINNSKGLMRILFSPMFLKPFTCVGFTFILYRLSSYNIISRYTVTYFEFIGISYDPHAVSIGYGAIRLISSMFVPVFLAMLKKRMGLVIFGSTSTLAMLAGTSM